MKLFRRILLAAAVLALIGLAFGYWLAFAPNTESYDGFRGVKIPAGASFEATLDSLETAGLLRSRTSLTWFGTATGWRRQVKPGHYRFESGASNLAMLDKIRKGRQDPIRVTIPPGVRPGVLAAVLRRDLDLDSAAFREALRDEDLARELGTDTAHLFGFMRPNSFDIYWTTSATGVVRRLKTEWERFWTDEMQQQADNLGLTKEQVLTMASIVEWEARVPEERARVAGVYLNRLLGRTPAGRMRLQADPTVQYALMEVEGGRMRRLLFQDYQLDHPYNTYRIDGLPPGPITNPSESSVRAVVQPEDHNYLFFVARGDGTHVFSRTFAEHQRAAAAYRSMMQERRREQAERERERQILEATPTQ
jgi:UPF0755 protein